MSCGGFESLNLSHRIIQKDLTQNTQRPQRVFGY